MLEHGKILELNDFFVGLNNRKCREVYFYRINGYTEEIGKFIKKYYELAQREGIVIEGKIPNPNEKNLAFYQEMLGFDFQMNEIFILKQLEQWLPRVNKDKRAELARCMYGSLEELQRAGKNNSIIKNVYIKFMCWLYYKFERIINCLGEVHVPKILYEGNISHYELILLSILSNIGCDVVLLQYEGDLNYLKIDANSMYSNNLELVGMEQFPNDFCLRFLRWNTKRLYGEKTNLLNCTDVCIDGEGVDDIKHTNVHMGTVAYQAERELDSLLYDNSGIYRNYQYKKANTIVLQTTYEEIKLLWNEEVKYRPHFSTIDNVVNIPVIFAKVSGITEGKIVEYWSSIKELITEDTIVIKNGSLAHTTTFQPVKTYVTKFYKNGKIQKTKIKAHESYPYGFLREEIQEHMLDKLQVLIEQAIIKGTFENGMEYRIIATVLNLRKDILRLLQNFDFTKQNPKLLYIHTKETIVSVDEAILVAYLSLVGFDVAFFVPTGYQIVEKYFNRKVMEEHLIGNFVYDLEMPNFENFFVPIGKKWFDKVLGKWK